MGIPQRPFSIPPVLSLRDVFPEIFSENSHICNRTLRQLIRVQDNYNGPDVYVFDSTLLGEGCSPVYEQNSSLTDYVLYNRTVGSGDYIPVDSINVKYFDSSELYLRKISSTPSDRDYVSIYSLIGLDVSQILPKESAGLSPYLQLAFRVAAVTYAMSCIQMRMIEVYMRDISRFNAEIASINQAFGTLSKIKQHLCTYDSQQPDNTDDQVSVNILNTASIPTKIFSFFARRNLLDDSLLAGTIIDKDKIASLCNDYKAYHDALMEADSVGMSSPVAAFTPNLFKAWTQFSTLVRHYGLFSGITSPTNIALMTEEQRREEADTMVREGVTRDVLFQEIWGDGATTYNAIIDCWNQFIEDHEAFCLLE
ncbi:MAG: hypothetical protein LBF24_02270, partial [Puniceicoccales bacterium]|nr:hypothetical protein [Puniceicoccales bacterium]